MTGESDLEGIVSTQNQRELRLGGILAETERRVKSLWGYADQREKLTLEELEHRAQELTYGLFAEAVQLVLKERSAAFIDDHCARCGRRTHYKGKSRRCQETVAGLVTWERGYYYCRRCRWGHYPSDEQMGVTAGHFSLGVQEEASRLGAAGSFAGAAETLLETKGLKVSQREVARIAEERGEILGEQLGLQDAKLLRGEQEITEQAPALEGTRCVALDGVVAPFRDGRHEIKVGVTFQTRVQGEGEKRTVRAIRQHYVAHIGRMEEIGAKLYAEAVRQGYRAERETVVCLADGAPGNWEQFGEHFNPRVEALDWYHATQHLWAAGNGLYGEQTPAAKEWVEARKDGLWAGNVDAVIQSLQTAADGPRGEAARAEIHYFRVNQERMRYDQCRANGYPVGSGVVESACKQLVTSRFCGAGMRWGPRGAQAILNLRAALLSHDWPRAWALAHPPRHLPKS